MLVQIKPRSEIQDKYFPSVFCYIPSMLQYCDQVVQAEIKTVIVGGENVTGIRFSHINWHPDAYTIISNPIEIISENYFIPKELEDVIQKAINDNNPKSK